MEKKKWKPGQSGNPGGRPKKKFCIPDILRKIGKTIPEGEKRTFYQLMCDKAWEQAIAGDKDARNWISDRTEGKAPETINFTEKKDEVIIE